MEKLNFIWIDDLPERSGEARNMAKAINVNIEFLDVKNVKLLDELKNVTKKEEPNLIIIDHNLEDTDSGIFKKGSSTTPFIRETWPECPIICISGVNINEVDGQQKSLYEEIFSINTVSKHYSEIFSIAASYKKAKENRPKSIDDILNLIECPELDRLKISSILPTDLKDNFLDSSLILELSKWVRNTLMKRPGFLYDRLWLATLIGIKEESFYKVEKKFSGALYNGIFSNPDNPRWWKSDALTILFELSDASGLPWVKGRGIEGIDENDYSICYATGVEFPETIAYEDQSRNSKRVPIKIKESILHPDFENLLYFEEIRLMKAAE
jgi:hypothetical protein